MGRSLGWLFCVTLLGACASPVELGQECFDTSDCRGGLVCVDRPGATPASQCMTECDPATTRLCEGGLVCIEGDGPAPGACYLGGTVAIGAACSETMASLDCAAGGVCVCRGSACTCERACRMDDMAAGCMTGEMCTLLGAAGTDGFCEPIPVP
ncbi:MAG: hypothetical protein K8H88_00295 [Sandaracinaceae bacterium]|nr:hypothetical protein [Sandaracinaceae bacterium]